jgi:hypothetical protein
MLIDEQPQIHAPPYTIDVDKRERRLVGHHLDDLTGNR